ncbi:SH3 domain-containing protein [Altericista sp. CCNU0014]|uniref:SH3 domain-containing protein n=1 Tax=Altericista sp. CCNU0014 TaxID=3082949 RepID=UPI00384DCD5C
MDLRRSIALGTAALSLAGLSIYSSPVQAEEGELAAKEANAQINLRSAASTQSDIAAEGKPGDRVQILGTSKATDGVVWYRVKVLRSGQLGWVRGDLIKVLEKSKTAATQKPASQSTAKVVAKQSKTAPPTKPTAPIPLKPPKSAAAPQKAAPATAAPKPAEQTKSPAAEPAPPAPEPASTQTEAASQSDIVSFQTPTYAVRIFSKAGHLRLNLFNRKSQQLALDSVPVESKNSGEQTTYSYGRDLKVTVVVPTEGTPTLTTAALGNTLEEQPETASAPPDAPEEAPK